MIKILRLWRGIFFDPSAAGLVPLEKGTRCKPNLRFASVSLVMSLFKGTLGEKGSMIE